MDNVSGRDTESKVANFQDAGPSQKTEKLVGDFVDENAGKREPANDKAWYHVRSAKTAGATPRRQKISRTYARSKDLAAQARLRKEEAVLAWATGRTPETE